MADPCDDIELIDLFVQIETKLSTLESNPNAIVDGVRRGFYDLYMDMQSQYLQLKVDVDLLNLQIQLQGFLS
jgi:hypothetical protein